MNVFFHRAPLRKSYELKKKQAYICIIYFFKTIHQHLVFYGRDGLDKAEYTKRKIAERYNYNRAGYVDSELTTEQGDTAFKEGNFKQALELYTALIEIDPLNSQLYSSRAQTNLQLKKYWEAHCDNKRAILLDSTCAKNYFVAARIYIEFGQLDKAEEMNKMAQRYVKINLRESIMYQTQEILEAKQKIKSNARISDRQIFSIEKGKENEPPEGKKIVEEFDKQINRGFEAYNAAKYSKAIGYIRSALSLATQYESEVVCVTNDDIRVLNFLHAMSCIYSSLNIQSASDILKSILREEIFPAAYYGLGVVSLLLCSYKEAENHLIHGLNILNAYNGKSYFWPHTDHVVQETDPSNLIKLFQIRLKECIPPKPDGICRFHVDLDNQDKKSVEIYQRCLDFKGSITIHCTCNCIINFHKACWKIYKQNLGDKMIDKEMLDIKCPTPMCWGTICTVCITSPTSEVKQFTSVQNERPTHTTTATTRPRLKLPTTSPDKILSKAEKKRLRKERRAQARLEAQEALISSTTETQTNVKPDITVEDYAVPDISQRAAPDCQVTLLKKDEPDLVVPSKQKPMKVKKKKEKVKNILPVDLQYAGDEERQRLSAYSLEEEDQSLNGEGIISQIDLPPPAAASFPVNQDGASADLYQLPRPASDESTRDIFHLFENLVRNAKALDLHGSLVKDILQNLSNESRYKIEAAGGIACFLSSNPVLVVIRNQYVTLNSSLLRPAPEKTFSWENRKKALEAIEQAALFKDFQKPNSLNPAAKEFVPLVKKGGYNELDTFELPEASRLSAMHPISLAAGKEGSEEAYEVNFNSVTSEKMLKLDSNKPVAYPPARQSYHSLDEITLGKGVKSSKLSTIDTIDDHEEGEDEDDNVPARRTNPNSDVSDFSCDRSVSPASTSSSVDRQGKVQAVLPMPLKVPKFSLPTRGKKKAVRPQLPSRHMPGHIIQKLPISGESSVSSSIAADDDDRESLASTSDKDSITDLARASPGTLWTGKFSKGKNAMEDGALSEQKKPVRRDLFDSAAQNPQHMDHLHLPYDSALEQQSTFPVDIWSASKSVTQKDDWLEQKFFPSFSQAPSVPSFTHVGGQKTAQKSRVLSQLASSHSLDSSYSISDKAENRKVWSNFDGPSESSWTPPGLISSSHVVSTEASDISVHRATIPQDPMGHSVLPSKGPWALHPEISATSSPLVQPSCLAPLDTTSMGWILSTLDSPLTASSTDMPAQDDLLRLDSEGFSRTPGKRGPFTASNKSNFFTSVSDIKSGCDDSPSLNDSEPFFPPSYLETSGSDFSAKSLSVDKSIQANPALLIASTQTDISGDITQKQKNEIKREDFSKIELIAAMKQKEKSDIIINRLEDQLIKERELRKNSELRIQLLKEERVKWLGKHKEVAQKHIAHLRAALTSLTSSREEYVKIEQKLRKWFVHYERCDITLARFEKVKEEDGFAEIVDSLQYYTSFISDLSDLAIQELADTDSSFKGTGENDSDDARQGSLSPRTAMNGSSKYSSESLVSEVGNKVEVNQMKRVPAEKAIAGFTLASARNIALFGKRGLPLRPLKPSGLLPRPSASLASQTQNTFEKIVQSIQETFPGYSRSSISKIIEELRKENGGSLSGFTDEILTRLIAERILKTDGVHASGHTAYSPEELLTGHGPRSVTDSYCTICHELIHYQDALTLDCHHKFHASCIQKWFGEDHSCPNCRKHVLLKEDFPSLR
ncbi:hypothetical protein Btru_031253 [Bulinus truncatus]|nr:hypothetical protein Btru_031253 [Bulinus truncatus]